MLCSTYEIKLLVLWSWRRRFLRLCVQSMYKQWMYNTALCTDIDPLCSSCAHGPNCDHKTGFSNRRSPNRRSQPVTSTFWRICPSILRLFLSNCAEYGSKKLLRNTGGLHGIISQKNIMHKSPLSAPRSSYRSVDLGHVIVYSALSRWRVVTYAVERTEPRGSAAAPHCATALERWVYSKIQLFAWNFQTRYRLDCIAKYMQTVYNLTSRRS